MKTLPLALLACAIALPAPTYAASPRQIDKNGVGNCVFSTTELPKGKEDTYKLTTKFKAGDNVHARCYFAKSVKEFTKEGKQKNSLRGPIEATIAGQAAPAGWFATITWSDDKSLWWHRSKMIYVESESGHWTEQRLDQAPPLGNDWCSWKMNKFNKPDDCVDFTTETKNLGAKLKKTGKYDAEVCVDLFFDKVDRTKIGDNLKEVDVIEAVPMARGCFNYAVDL